MLTLTRAAIEKSVAEVGDDKRLHGSIMLVGGIELVGGVVMKRPNLKKAGIASLVGGAGGMLLREKHPVLSATSSLAGAAISSYFIFR